MRPFAKSQQAATATGLLSWGSLKERPSVDTSRVRPLPVARGPRVATLPSSFRSCRSSRLQRLAPHSTLQVCCTLQPTMGSAWFRADRRLSPIDRPSSQALNPSKLFPFLAAALPVTEAHTSSPGLQPSRRRLTRSEEPDFAPTSGLSPQGKCAIASRCCHRRTRRCFPGFSVRLQPSLRLQTTRIRNRSSYRSKRCSRHRSAVSSATAFPRHPLRETR